jgi:hypothetical protein
MATFTVPGTPPGPSGFSCPPGQTLVLAAVSYGATLTDTTSNVSKEISASRTFFNVQSSKEGGDTQAASLRASGLRNSVTETRCCEPKGGVLSGVIWPQPGYRRSRLGDGYFRGSA